VSERVLNETADTVHGSEQPAHEASWHLPRPRWLSWSLLAVAGLVFVAWLFLAAVHVDDRYQLDHVSGVRMALAQYFDRGTLYPPLYDGQFYGGTRFMPIPIVVHGSLAKLTGEYLISGKLLGYAVMLALLVVMVVLLRKLRCPLPVAMILPALVLTTKTGLAAPMDMRADALPLLLQVLAVWIVASTAGRKATVAAAALAALALMTKLSAIWAPIAVFIWLVRRDRKRLATFSVAYVVLTVTLTLLFTGLTQGRMLENVLGLSASGITWHSVLLAPYRFFHLMVEVATTAWAVVPLVALAAWIAVRERRGSIYLVSLFVAFAVLLVVLTDVGTGWNQLIDVVVLSALVIGELAARVRVGSGELEGPAARIAGMAIGLALLWVTLSGFVVTIIPPVEATVRGDVSFREDPLSGPAFAGISVLSEDPYVPLSLGQVPVVLDPFMLPRLTEREPDAIPDLIRRIETKEFDIVVLVEPLDPVDRDWWAEQDLGIDLVRAISSAYTYAGRTQGYYLYEPRQAGSEG
jgi:hypothetical protein